MTLRLFYRFEARKWTEALALGNGRLGAMVFGGVERERLQMNEDTLWSGGPKDGNNPGAKQVLPKVRELIFGEQYAEADLLSKQMMGPYTQSYMPMADLFINFFHGQYAREYERQLDLETGIVTVRYRIGNLTYTREMMISRPDEVIVVRLSVSPGGQLDFRANMESPLRYETTPGDDRLILSGKAPAHVDPTNVDSDQPVVYGRDGDDDGDDESAVGGMTFACHLTALSNGGRIRYDDQGLHVEGAQSATLILSAATSFNGFDRCPVTEGRDPQALAEEFLMPALDKPYETLRTRHVAEHRKLFNRMHLHIEGPMEGGEENADDPTSPASPENWVAPEHLAALPTDERLMRFGANDPGLVTLLFQYGRYLLMAASRPGNQPAHLQGIWNDMVRPPWSSNWTLNINTEMNYWPAESCNLSECHEPLFDFIAELAVKGRKTAEINYGCRGWVAHHNSDIWRQSAPVGGFGDGQPIWSMWQMAAPWLCQHLFEHYQYGGDQEFLRTKAYPLMRDAALFCLDWLVEDENGHLVTAPSTSPEHRFVTVDGTAAAISAGAAMDLSLIWDLFSNCIEASTVLDVDHKLREQWIEARKRLHPLTIGEDGRLQEWSRPFEDEEPQHRHVSHLFGLYPGRQITDIHTADLWEAAKQSLIYRGDGGTGWCIAWKIGLWARLLDGDHALKLIANLMTPVGISRYEGGGGGVYLNLFDAHPPFQIDGNFGFTAGVAEMLLQSHAGYLHVLPGLPKKWAAGEITGLRARGGFEVNITWSGGRMEQTSILSVQGNECTLRTDQPVKVICDGHSVPTVTLSYNDLTYPEHTVTPQIGEGNGQSAYFVRFPTQAGLTYQVLPHSMTNDGVSSN